MATTMASILEVDMRLSVSDTDSIKSTSSSENDSDSSDSSLDSEDINLESMSSSQFLILPKGDSISLNSDDQLFQSLDGGMTPTASICISSSTNSLDSLDDDPTPTSSICIPSPAKPAPAISTSTHEREISYARDPYSASSISHLLPSHLKEDQFVNVSEGDALIVLQELTEFLWSEYRCFSISDPDLTRCTVVKVCRTETIGIIPAWNVEGELERVARINMELNGRVRRPARLFCIWTDYSCMIIQVSTPVVEIGSPLSSSSDGESSVPTTPVSSIDDHSPILAEFRPIKVRKMGPRSVGFQPAKPQVMFRYPSERFIQSEVVDEVPVGWSCGWLEGDEESVLGVVAVPKTPRRGRKRNRKRV